MNQVERWKTPGLEGPVNVRDWDDEIHIITSYKAWEATVFPAASAEDWDQAILNGWVRPGTPCPPWIE